MRSKVAVFILIGLSAVPSWAISAEDGRVVRVEGTREKDGAKYASTGFCARVNGVAGVVTTLHSVAAASEIRARNTQCDFWMRIDKVDIARDLVFLVRVDHVALSVKMYELGPMPTTADTKVHVIGYPGNVRGQQLFDDKDVHLAPNFRSSVDDCVVNAGDNREALRNRRSPDFGTTVLVFRGDLSPGLSGAPVVVDGRAVAVVDGGLGPGYGVHWAIPVEGVDWGPVDQGALDEVGSQKLGPLVYGVEISGAPRFRWNWGAIVGIGGSRVCDGDKCGNFASSYVAGVSLERELGTLTWLTGEAVFSDTGSDGTIIAGSPAAATGETYTIQAKYVELNGLLAQTIPVRGLATRVGAGIGVGLPISNAFEAGSATGVTTDVDASFNTAVNVFATLGVRFAVGNTPILPELRLAYSLTDVGSPTDDPRTSRLSGKMLRFLLTVRVAR